MFTWSDIRDLLSGLRREEGQGMAEYAVILGVITIAVVVALTALAGGIGRALDEVTKYFPGVGS